ncbi:hypothetical protein FPQ18DRAFT_314234 [Pyronema domesticum]|uniref:Uncharacterized protein n=1 Tax=Pyronema omphalodes (strain CBS 100304) TaxID=1076935 RepID=U4L8Z4_PYROM|nr:hypothetical protein FPQ18DRAFT_314234 [Pyronema domesticum]CCX13528.1 Protein of unknown function [Pyronema omphalodes CBS 100304]
MSLRPRLTTLLRRPPLLVLPSRLIQTQPPSTPTWRQPPSSGGHPWNHDPPRHPHERMKPGTSIFVMKSGTSLETPLFKFKGSQFPFAVVNADVVDNPLHPLYKRTEQQYKEKINQLNIYCIIPLAVHKNASVRNRIRRRITEAARRVLGEYGWGIDGEPIDQKKKKKKEVGEKNGGYERTAERMVAGILEDSITATPDRKEKLLGTMAFWPTYKAVSADWEELMKLVRQAVDKLLVLKGCKGAETKISRQRIGEYKEVRSMARNSNQREREERGEQIQKLPVKRGVQERKYPVIGDGQDKRRDNFGPVRGADQQSGGYGGQERQQQSQRRDDRQNFNNNRDDSRPLIRRQGNEGAQQQNSSREESRPMIRRPGGNDGAQRQNNSRDEARPMIRRPGGNEGGQRPSSPVRSNSQSQREPRPTQQQLTQKTRPPMDWRSRGI